MKFSKNKYNAKKVEFDGYCFASLGEKACYELLKESQAAGEIEVLQTQDHVKLTAANIDYIADFKIFDKDLNDTVWVEFKGIETDTWRLKRRLWMKYGPGRLRIYKAKGKSIALVEEIIPDNMNPKGAV